LPKNYKKKIINNKDVSYLNRDFESFRNDLVRYSRTHYRDKISDLSESSLAGLFIDVASYVGDVMSFYLDHQFNELSLETAVEENNLERLIRQTGVEIVGASPAYVEVTFSIMVDAKQNSDGSFGPDEDQIPIIVAGTILTTSAGVNFELLDDIDFSKKDDNGEYLASFAVKTINSESNPVVYTMVTTSFCTSAKTSKEIFTISSDFIPFRKVALSSIDVSEIIDVIDADNDNYYEVQSLTQNTVFIREKNTLPDYISVPERLKLIPAPKRYEKITSRETGITSIRFGSGKEDMFDEDVIPDPSEHAIKLFGDKKNVTYASIDPNNFLGSKTLGISPVSTTITVRYRHGGGVSHNVAAGQINDVKTLITKFSENLQSTIKVNVRSSVSVVNLRSASGGENEPSLESLRQIALNSQNSQGRIVTKEDLIARVYALPNNFGRVFRAGVRSNPLNPFSSYLHVISRDENKKLTQSSDVLKENLSVYLNKYRLITDAIDIVDTKIINIGINYTLAVEEKFNSGVILQAVNAKLSNYFDIKNFQIDQPVYLSEMQNLIINTHGVISLLEVNIINLKSNIGNNVYSSVSYDPKRYIDRGILYPAQGGIFEIKFPNDDIKGRVR